MKKLLFAFLLFSSVNISAQTTPSPETFHGYKAGAKFTPHYKIVEYCKVVANAASQNVVLQSYGTTNEGKELLTLTISSDENIKRINEIKANNIALVNGNTTRAANQPAIVWLSYNVHGNEPSSSEAAMQTLYELVNPANTKTKEWLKNTVVIIDPCLNPDGRDRYVNWFNSITGKNADADAQSREHSEPWPGGRVNHYYFDLNRDWVWQTQTETQQRLKIYNEWMPQVHVDFHEQFYNSPYYFAPAAEPFHEVITPWQRNFQTTIGRKNAQYFDANNWLYFTKEYFDLFYPSYGDTYPLFNGAIGMTYEQGGHSRGGLSIEKNDGDTLTLADRVMHHVTTGLATIETASENHSQLIQEFKKYFTDNRNAVNHEYKTYILTSDSKDKINALKQLFVNNNIASGNTSSTGKGYNYASGKTENINYKKYQIAVSMYQPKSSLAKVLLEPQGKLSDSVTYDITAWSLPYVYGVDAYAVKEKLDIITYAAKENRITIPKNAYGYLINYNSFQSAKALAYLLKNNVKVRTSEKAFVYKGKQYKAGTLILLNVKDEAILQQVYDEYNVTIDAVSTGFMDAGVDFGSESVSIISKPVIAMLTGTSTDANASGEIWHYFENELNYPLTLLNVSEVNNLNLSKYNTIILPNGYYNANISTTLKDYVNKGGKLIAIDNAVKFLANNEWTLKLKENKDESKPAEYADVKIYAERERESVSSNIPGAIYKTQLDVTHPLAYGMDSVYYTLKKDENLYEFMKDGWNVGVIKKNALIAGFAGSKIKQNITDGTIIGTIPMGSGQVVFFADDPVFRGFWENGKLLLNNALFMVR